MQPSLLCRSYLQMYDKLPKFYEELLYKVTSEVEYYSRSNFRVAINRTLTPHTQSISPDLIMVSPAILVRHPSVIAFCVAHEAARLLQDNDDTDTREEDRQYRCDIWAMKFLNVYRYDLSIAHNYRTGILSQPCDSLTENGRRRLLMHTNDAFLQLMTQGGQKPLFMTSP